MALQYESAAGAAVVRDGLFLYMRTENKSCKAIVPTNKEPFPAAGTVPGAKSLYFR